MVKNRIAPPPRSARAAIRKLRRQVEVGLKQARRGQLLDGEEVFRDLLESGRRSRRSIAGVKD